MNWQHEPHLEMQIRTRGAVRTRGSAAVTRTRGAVRTRDGVAVETKSLAQLVAELRAQAQGSPSAVVIHGWDEAPAQMFLSHLMTLLDEDAAVWVVPAETAQSMELPPAWPEAVVLDLSREVDARTYANLVVDLVFFPTGAPAEVRQWHNRTEAVIVGAAAGQVTALLEEAPHNAPAIYAWSTTKPEVLMSL